MKKLLFTICAVIMGFTGLQAQNPTLYLRGDINTWGTGASTQTGSKGESCTFTESGGVYTLTLSSLAGSFKIADGSWGSYNFGGNGATKVSMGTPVTLNNSGSSGNLSPAESWTNVTLTFTLSTKVLVVTGQQKEQVITWGLKGNFTSSSWPTIDMTETSKGSGIWEGKVTPAQAACEFGLPKLGDGAQLDWWTNNGATISESNTTISLSQGDGNTKATLVAGKTYTFTWNEKTSQLSLSWDDVITYPETLYVIGNVNNGTWAPNNGFQLQKTEEGIFSGEVTLNDELGSGNGYFSFTTALGPDASQDSWNKMGARYGAKNNDFLPSFTSANTIQVGENSFYVPVGTYTMTVNLKEMTLTIVQKEEPLTTPENVYLIGTLTEDGNWNLPGTKMDNEGDGQFVLKNVAFYETVDADGLGYFAFTSSDSDQWTAVNANCFRPEGDVDTLVESGEEYPFVNANNEKAWQVAPGIYDVYFLFEDGVITVEYVSDLPTPELSAALTAGDVTPTTIDVNYTYDAKNFAEGTTFNVTVYNVVNQNDKSQFDPQNGIYGQSLSSVENAQANGNLQLTQLKSAVEYHLLAVVKASTGEVALSEIIDVTTLGVGYLGFLKPGENFITSMDPNCVLNDNGQGIYEGQFTFNPGDSFAIFFPGNKAKSDDDGDDDEEWNFDIIGPRTPTSIIFDDNTKTIVSENVETTTNYWTFENAGPLTFKVTLDSKNQPYTATFTYVSGEILAPKVVEASNLFVVTNTVNMGGYYNPSANDVQIEYNQLDGNYYGSVTMTNINNFAGRSVRFYTGEAGKATAWYGSSSEYNYNFSLATEEDVVTYAMGENQLDSDGAKNFGFGWQLKANTGYLGGKTPNEGVTVYVKINLTDLKVSFSLTEFEQPTPAPAWPEYIQLAMTKTGFFASQIQHLPDTDPKLVMTEPGVYTVTGVTLPKSRGFNFYVGDDTNYIPMGAFQSVAFSTFTNWPNANSEEDAADMQEGAMTGGTWYISTLPTGVMTPVYDVTVDLNTMKLSLVGYESNSKYYPSTLYLLASASDVDASINVREKMTPTSTPHEFEVTLTVPEVKGTPDLEKTNDDYVAPGFKFIFSQSTSNTDKYIYTSAGVDGENGEADEIVQFDNQGQYTTTLKLGRGANMVDLTPGETTFRFNVETLVLTVINLDAVEEPVGPEYLQMALGTGTQTASVVMNPATDLKLQRESNGIYVATGLTSTADLPIRKSFYFYTGEGDDAVKYMSNSTSAMSPRIIKFWGNNYWPNPDENVGINEIVENGKAPWYINALPTGYASATYAMVVNLNDMTLALTTDKLEDLEVSNGGDDTLQSTIIEEDIQNVTMTIAPSKDWGLLFINVPAGAVAEYQITSETQLATASVMDAYEECPKWKGQYCVPLMPKTTGSFTVRYNLNGYVSEPQTWTYKVEVGRPTGVNGIAADEDGVEYYTLDGVKVKNPERGIYIRVANGKTTKVVK